MDAGKDSSSEQVSRFWSKISLMAEITAVFRKVSPGEETYLRALESIKRVVPFESAALYLFSRNDGRLAGVTAYGEKIDLSLIGKFTTEDDFSGWLKAQRQPVLLSGNRTRAGTRSDSILVVPLLVEENLIGVSVFVDGRENSFREKDLKLLTVIGDHMALSIDRSMYQKDLQKKNHALAKAQRLLKETQEKMIDDEKLEAVRELAASVNHQINNPLSVITGNIEYLLHVNKELDDRVIERLKIIQSEASRITEVNRRLLEIQSLVTHTYLEDDETITMLNLQESSGGVRNG